MAWRSAASTASRRVPLPSPFSPEEMGEGRGSRRKSAGSKIALSVSTAARSMACSSSRTLPGQRWASSQASVSSLKTTARPRRPASRVAKWRASGLMSARRSARGGRWMVMTLRRSNKSSRKRPAAASAASSLAVAASNRTSTRRVRWSPTRRISLSCSTRRSFAWSGSGSSPISSSSNVPPSACSNSPALSADAPVNAPRTWPNSSDSSRLSGIAAQLIATNGAAARGLAR